MTKHDLTNTVAEVAKIDHDIAGKALDALTAVITDGLKHERSIRIHGIGTFTLKDRAARKGRNPRTGAEIDIPAGTRVAFKAAKGLVAS